MNSTSIKSFKKKQIGLDQVLFQWERRSIPGLRTFKKCKRSFVWGKKIYNYLLQISSLNFFFSYSLPPSLPSSLPYLFTYIYYILMVLIDWVWFLCRLWILTVSYAFLLEFYLWEFFEVWFGVELFQRVYICFCQLSGISPTQNTFKFSTWGPWGWTGGMNSNCKPGES